MAAVSLRGIDKGYGGVRLLAGFDLEVADGEFVVLLGPSGCGKSTLLRLIAGLERPDAGELALGGVAGACLDPASRGIAMVFQELVLYPHMTVAANLGFALRLAGMPADQVQLRVWRAAESLRIAHLLGRRPPDLSGGERRRVAIGRALVREPALFLFDEPLAGLDAELRSLVRAELARLQREQGATVVYATQDQDQAMRLGQRIVVLDRGRIVQAGQPAELYRRPANLFVAGLLGTPRMNFLAASLVGEQGPLATVRLAGGAEVAVAADVAAAAVGAPLTLGLRPEHLCLRPGADPGEGAIPGTLGRLEDLGDATLAHVQVDGAAQPVALRCGGAVPAPGSRVLLDFAPERGRLFGADGSALPAHA